MKKNLFNLFLLSMLACVLFSCSREAVKTKTYKFSEEYYLTDAKTDGVYSIDIRVQLPVEYKNAGVLTTLRNSIVAHLVGEDYVRYSNGEFLTAFTDMIKREYKEQGLPLLNDRYEESMVYNNELQLNGEALMNDGRIFSYRIKEYVFTGGAHGLQTLTYFNYDMANGKQFGEEDIFTEGSTDFISNLIKQRIVEQNDEIDSLEGLDKIYWTEYIKPNNNFYVTEKGINYVFNPYDIAPYVYGSTEVSLSFAELTPVLKKDSPVGYLVK